MWVLFKKTYIGSLGTFLAGLKRDLTKTEIFSLRRQLGKKNVIKTCAPWEEQKMKNEKKQAEKAKEPNNQKMQTSPKDRQFRPENQADNYRTKEH